MDPNINPLNSQQEAYEAPIINEPAGTPDPAPAHAAAAPEPSYIEIARTRRGGRPAADISGAVQGSKPTPKRSGLAGLMLAGMLMLGMVLGGAGAEAVTLVARTSPAPVTATSVAASGTSQASNASSAELVAAVNQTTINSIYRTVSPSIVMITSQVQSNNGRFGTVTGEATGSGVLLDKQGDILTNYHVIEGATSTKIELSDGTEYAATVVGTAPQDDLAVIKAAVPSDKLTPIALGDSSAVQVGDEVIAMGYPYSTDLSVTSGIVSGLNRDGTGSTGNRTLTGLIQTDAAINPGNSGGPLLNAQGQLIGINTLIESPVEAFTGVGLAIPVNHVKDLLSQLEQGTTVQRPWIGLAGTEITSGLQAQYSLPVKTGILVMDVTSGSPAADAGLQASTVASSQSTISQIGDIIVAVDGKTVSSVAALTGYLNGKQPGDTVSLTIIRGSQQQNVTVTLQAWSTSANATASGS